MWKALDAGKWSKELLEAALERVPAHAKGDLRELTTKAADSGLFLIEYRDGFKAAVAMMNGWVHEGDGGAFTLPHKSKVRRSRGRRTSIRSSRILSRILPIWLRRLTT